MEILRLCAPPLISPSLPPPTTRKLYKLNAVTGGSGSVSSSFSASSKWADRLLADFQFLPSTTTTTTADPPGNLNSTTPGTLASPFTPPLAPVERNVAMPVDFYRILDAEAHFLGDGIRRAYEAKVTKPPQYGYSEDALVSRRLILQAASETLANPSSRREYNQGLAEDEYDTITTQVPWDKVKF